MALDFIALSDVVQDSKDKVTITATSDEEFSLTRRVPTCCADIMRFKLFNWGHRCLLHVEFGEVVDREIIFFEKLVLASDPDVSCLRVRDHHLASSINFTINWKDKVFWQALLNVCHNFT